MFNSKQILKLLGVIALILCVLACGASPSTESPSDLLSMTPPPDYQSGLHIRYQPYVYMEGWKDWAYDGQDAGTTGQTRYLEAIMIELINAPSTMGVAYKSYVYGSGWTDWTDDGQVTGTTGESKEMEAISIKLTNAPQGFKVAYQAYLQFEGWTDWAYDGQVAGTTGQSRGIEAIRIKIITP